MSIVLLLAGCLPQSQPPMPEKVKGLWELHQVAASGGEVAARDLIAQSYPGCLWGRMTWNFEEDHLTAGFDILCPAESGDYYGCNVQARVPAQWNETNGEWLVEYPVAARSRTVGQTPDALQVPTSCEVRLAAGVYPVVRVRNKDWRWEMGTPDGTEFQLKLPDSERPDYVAAIRSTPGGQ